jgi:hypothetical protein
MVVVVVQLGIECILIISSIKAIKGTSKRTSANRNGENNWYKSLYYKSFWLDNVKINICNLVAEPRAIRIVLK